MPDPKIIVAAVEGGGTSFVVAVAEVLPSSSSSPSEPPRRLHQLDVDSSHDQPHVTLQACADFLQQHRPPGGYHALGVACFGPIGLQETSPLYGHILPSSPKAAWRNINLLSPLVAACRGPTHVLHVRVETDVNAPALAEYRREQHRLDSVAYVTVGTGIGVGLVLQGQPVHGRLHPEGGHVPVQPLAGDDFPGYSWGKDRAPFHGIHTVEGIASSVALTERLERQQLQTSSKTLSRSALADLPDDHEVWQHAANALANLCVTLLLVTSVEKIVLGGGIMNRKGLLSKIQVRTVELMNGYVELKDLSTLITTSHYGSQAGLVGAMVLAQTAYVEGTTDDHVVKATKNDSASAAFNVGVIHGVVLGVGMGIAGMLLARTKPR